MLDVSNNRICRVEHLQGLSQLQDLWLNDNAIPSLEGLQDALADQRESLTTIYLENNPAAAAPGYKQRVLALFPNLTQLDADVLGVTERIKAAAAQRQAARTTQQRAPAAAAPAPAADVDGGSGGEAK